MPDVVSLLRAVATVLGRLADSFETMADNAEQNAEPHLTVVPEPPVVVDTDGVATVPDDDEMAHERKRQEAQSVSEAVAASEKAT